MATLTTLPRTCACSRPAAAAAPSAPGPSNRPPHALRSPSIGWRARALGPGSRGKPARLHPVPLAAVEAAAVEAPPADTATFRARLAAALTTPDTGPRALAGALLAAAAAAAPFPDSLRAPHHRVPGCASATWVSASLSPADGTLLACGTSDARLTAGVVAAIAGALTGLSPAAALALTASDLAAAGLTADAAAGAAISRAAGPASILASLQARARAALAGGGPAAPPPFPSLIIGSGGRLEPLGPYAQAQARFLRPDPEAVAALASSLTSKKVGVVAHFYMDPEVQGVLAAAASHWPHIRISDSLAMADAAVGMAAAGCGSIAVLGVDFMSENVRAILDGAGFADVAVLRMSAAAIGCTLADAADAPGYGRWLEAGAAEAAQEGAPALHVVYINTSLRSKAASHAAMPTITCTSSNVVSTVLSAFAAVPGLRLFYGPDAYMGANLASLLESVAGLGDAAAAALHPAHTAASLRSARSRLAYFEEGTCAVHHMFGGGVAGTVAARYGDALLAAHFEVPGELFSAALAASRPATPGGRPRGCVGSTQNILDFIGARVDEALADAKDSDPGRQAAAAAGVPPPVVERVRVVLGTETGMVTSIVRAVQARLDAAHPATQGTVEVEVIFPVADEAVAAGPSAASGPTARQQPTLPGGLALIPGPASGEGCSASGGCAACPYMKMNTLSALQAAADAVGEAGGAGLLVAQAAARHTELLLMEGSLLASSPIAAGKTVAEVGCAPILHMRAFQRGGGLPEELLADIGGRRGGGGGT